MQTFHHASQTPRLPSPWKLARALRAFFARIRAEVLPAIRAGQPIPDLGHWLPHMVQVLTPLVGPVYRQGAQQGIERIAQLTGRRVQVRRNFPRRFLRQKEGPIISDSLIGFDIFNPRIETAIQQAVLSFCQETLDTLTTDLQTGMAKFRAQLLAGLEAGEAQPKITRRVQEIFNDANRSFRIATTETSRAVHGGQLIAARETGIVNRHRWLASADACPACLALDGKEVDLNDPFENLAYGNPAYRTIWHPPLHPHCFCVDILIL
jgi:hypothetical protein